ncbi:Hypothetical predicted protein [Mytilus galloprovincialis]|nr:Hypothetical predicted protein [Mytilus galloprovincialis]
MFRLLHSNGLVNWNDRDNDQSTPLHYAFCHSNYEFSQIAIILKIDFDVRSSNGSTPYHSAAVCLSLTLYVFMCTNTEYKLTIPDAKDINGLSILQYGSHIRSIDINLLLEVALVSKHDLYHTDISGKNFLHYAAANGNFFLYLFVIQKVPQVATDLLQQKDAFGNTPVDELFACMPSQKVMKPFKLPTFGDYKQFLFSADDGKLLHLDILSPHESFIAFVLDHLITENILDHFNIKNYILLSILKTRSHPLFYLKIYAKEQYNDAIRSL